MEEATGVIKRLQTTQTPQCLWTTCSEFISLYMPQILSCLVYDMLMDLTIMNNIAHIASFMVGVVLLATYDIVKLCVLAEFVFGSTILITILTSQERYLTYTGSTPFMYSLCVVLIYIYLMASGRNPVYEIENPEHRWMLCVAFMSIIAFKSSNPYRGPRLTWFCSWPYLGYVFNPATVLNGPWIPPELYENVFLRKQSILQQSNQMWTVRRAKNMVLYLLIGFIHFSLAKCVLPLLVSEEYLCLCMLVVSLSNRLLHYAQLNVSSGTLIAAGYNYNRGSWTFPLCSELAVEFPVSLPSAFPGYDRHVFLFLRRYYVNRYYYLRTSFVHSDLIFIPFMYLMTCCDTPQVGPVIALCSSHEFVKGMKYLQDIIADKWVCMRRYPCVPGRYCPHTFKKHHVVTLAMKLLFASVNLMLISYLHMAFIDVPLTAEISGYKEIWKSVNYIGHQIVIINYLLCLVVIESHGTLLQRLRPPTTARSSQLSVGGNQGMSHVASIRDSLQMVHVPHGSAATQQRHSIWSEAPPTIIPN